MKSFKSLIDIKILIILAIAMVAFNFQCKKDCNEIIVKDDMDSILVNSCFPDFMNKSTINGVSFVGSNVVLQEKHVKPIQRINSNWVAFMPIAFVRSGEHILEFNGQNQWRGERVEGMIESIEIARKLDQKICIKLHVWSHVIPYTGDYELSSEQEWIEFEKSYTEYCLLYARLAEEYDVELFCIGVEWKKFVMQRTDYWNNLIKEVKKIYHGKITYAANWDEYKTVPFWKELDYIGIDGYFPLSPNAIPDSCEIKDYWKKHTLEMDKVSKREDKKILFTEYGYRSMEFSTYQPWDWNINHPISLDAQSNAYKALYNSVWQEEWFEGGFLWKWYHNDVNSGGHNNNKFTPQNKPVERVIKKYYKKYE